MTTAPARPAAPAGPPTPWPPGPSPATAALVRGAAAAAVRHLVAARGDDGWWTDLDLPVGPSTEWVTAHVAGALALAARAGVAPALARQGLAAADDALGDPAPGRDGWGFNAGTEPDADTTALALVALHERGRTPQAALRLLQAHARPDGWATYLARDAWGDAHPCVTPVVALALATVGRDVGDVVPGVRARELDDGSWPAYWWRTSHVSTYWNLLLLSRLGARIAPRRPAVGTGPATQVRTGLDLACVLGATHLRCGHVAATDRLVRLVASRQRPDGGFDGGPDLRVTHATCHRPWEEPESAPGALYPDGRGLITTAMTLRVLVGLLGVTP